MKTADPLHTTLLQNEPLTGKSVLADTLMHVDSLVTETAFWKLWVSVQSEGSGTREAELEACHQLSTAFVRCDQRDPLWGISPI